MYLREPWAFYSTDLCDNNTNALSICLKARDSLVLVILILWENLWIRHHIKPHKEMEEYSPFNDGPWPFSQIKPILGRVLIKAQEEDFVSPVLDEAQKKSGKVQERNGCRVHHNDEQHRDHNWIPVLDLEHIPSVELLVLILNDLLCVLSVGTAPSVPASLAQSLTKESCVSYWKDAVEEASHSNRDSNLSIPVCIELFKVALEQEWRQARFFKDLLDDWIVSKSIIDS